MKIKKNSSVKHNTLGNGIVKYIDDDTAGVRFDNGSIEEVSLDDLSTVVTFESSIKDKNLANDDKLLLKIQAETIISINDTWGIFSLSKIDLLPHQLWVCKRVLEQKPFRWLVADDVGLGKTVEAGLILWPLLSRNIVKRVLVLCPSSLVMQWQERLRNMFEIRLMPYQPGMDNNKTDFWNSYDKVVASFHTLRLDRNERHNRILQGKKWDLVIVDEAHHLNANDQKGETQGYKLIDKMQKAELIDSMLFFTGTPHRGKNYGFLSLLHLLRQDLFNPKGNYKSQLSNINKVMIRNNKENVTDLDGNKLFQKPIVKSITYKYSEKEAIFYDKLTSFILSGEAYADSLGIQEKNAVMLVLIAFQKIASSSIAAIKKALNNRLLVVRSELDKSNKVVKEVKEYQEVIQNGTADERREVEENLSKALKIYLMENEEKQLLSLLGYANEIKEESRIKKIIELIERDYTDESILFFTEYKATQSLLISKLLKKYGRNDIAFINGDEKVYDVIDENGKKVNIEMKRDTASERFNDKKVRFLISTEAAGEGIDLQKNCHILIHVDIPWNPMRMQQRVGRINRFGQTKQVEVVTMYNPDTVESRIWNILDEKITNIMEAHGSAMNDPEDFKWLILGMKDDSFYNSIQLEARDIPKEKFSDWFDNKAQTFAGEDALDTISNLIGNSQKFNYSKESKILPKFDLCDLEVYFQNMVKINGHNFVKNEETFSFVTPGAWKNRPGMKKKYDDISFHRKNNQKLNIIGIGNRLMEQALNQAVNFDVVLKYIPKARLSNSLFVYKVYDKITNGGVQVRNKIFTIEYSRDNESYKVIDDNSLFRIINDLLSQNTKIENDKFDIDIKNIEKNCSSYLVEKYTELDLPFSHPDSKLLGVFWSI